MSDRAAAEWTARFRAYAAAHGRTPEAQLAHDVQIWRGGRMTGFILWLGQRLAEWRRLRGLPRGVCMRAEDHQAFDAWLMSPVECQGEARTDG